MVVQGGQNLHSLFYSLLAVINGAVALESYYHSVFLYTLSPKPRKGAAFEAKGLFKLTYVVNSLNSRKSLYSNVGAFLCGLIG
jgi:hypothetical protein